MSSPVVLSIAKRLVEAGLADDSSFVGCSDAEIAIIESKFSIELPRLYSDFMRLMGKFAGDFLEGLEYSFPEVLSFREHADRMMAKAGSTVVLPQGAFVFLINPRVCFLYFEAVQK